MVQEENPLTDETVNFGEFTLRVSERLLQKAGVPLHLGARSFDILTVLVDRAGQFVSKKELMARVWSDVTVDEGSLRFHIGALRKALGDGLSGARYIATLSGRGYCFVAPTSRSIRTGSKPAAVQSAAFEGPHRLPARLMRMVGRDDTVQRIAKKVMSDRFVSVVGPGGIGKTTVAVSIGHMMQADFLNAVYFFDLGPLNDPLLVPSTVASTLGLLVQSNDPAPGLIAFLRDKRVLLIFDSCEHVVETMAVLAERIFQEAPQVYILATSRESLRVDGEHVLRLPPLESPPLDAGLSAAELLAFPAAQLFVERVIASGRRFELSDNDARTVGEICRRLDGIALAIELAAGRVNAFGLGEIASLLDDRFRLLWEGRRTALHRHQTLGATLDWSYNLLSDTESLVLRRISVFVGVFTPEAAATVAAGNDIGEEEVATAIANLVAKSLVTASSDDGAARFRLLDITRAYALEKLIESGHAAESSRHHAIYYLKVLQCGKVGSPMVLDVEQLAAHQLHISNIRAALAWCFSESGDSQIGTALAAASASIFFQMSLLGECRHWTERAIDALDDTIRGTRSEIELQAALGLSLMFTKSNNEQASAALTRGLILAEELGDLPNQLRLIGRLHHFYYRTGDFRRAMELAQRGEILAKEIADPVGIALAHSMLGISHYLLEDLVAARTHLEAALLRVPMSTHITPFHLGLDYRNRANIFLARTFWLLGYPEKATQVARRAIEDAETFYQPLNLCIALLWAVSIYLWIGDWASAAENTDRLIARASEHSVVPYEAAGIGLKGCLSIKRGDADTGIRLLRVSLEALQTHRYELLTTNFNMILAEGLLMKGLADQALQKIEETIDWAGGKGDLLNMPELLRIKGDILASDGRADFALAEVCYLRSIAIASASAALTWELRTATSLALLWSGRDRVEEAQGVLAPVVARFTEGFGSADFLAAQQMLDHFARNP